MRLIHLHGLWLGFEVTDNKAYDFEAIEAAVMETDRGRWFLAEFARRHKNADTETLLEAIHKLEAAMGERGIAAGNDALGRELSSMAAALRTTEAEMRQVSSDRLADGGAVPAGRTAFEDVGERAKNLAAGLNATAEALRSASDELRQEPAVGETIASLDDDLLRLAEHNVAQDLLSRRIAKAMDLIAHLQERIQASLAPGEERQDETSEDSPARDEAMSPDEISYFDADRELFTPPETAPAPAPGLAADDPENAPHLADMLEDALAGMQLGGEAEPAASQATQVPEAEEAAAAPAQPEPKASQPPADEPSSAASPPASGDEVPADDEAPKTRRVVIVRESLATSPPSSSRGEAKAAGPCRPAAPEDAQASAAEASEAPADADADTIVFAEPEAPVATEPEPSAAAEEDQAAPASGSGEESGPEAIMKMFAEAAAKHGMQPATPAVGESEARAAPEDRQPEPAAEEKEARTAPLEPMTPGEEERRRIVVIRRGSSADTSIPLEDPESDGTEAKA